MRHGSNQGIQRTIGGPNASSRTRHFVCRVTHPERVGTILNALAHVGPREKALPSK